MKRSSPLVNAVFAAALLCVIAMSDTAMALNSCQSDGIWDNGATWGGGVPVDAQDVYIPSGFTVTITNSSAYLSSFTNAGTLIFTNWVATLDATNITIADNGLATLPRAFRNTEMSNRVYMVCSNLTVATNGAIDVDGLGFAAVNNLSGQGPGGGFLAHGAGHGGHGLPVFLLPFNGKIYGDPVAPVEPVVVAARPGMGLAVAAQVWCESRQQESLC